jgi:hypothetical protein
MSKCDNCVKSDVCRIRTYPSQYGLTGDGCDHCKDKSLFVELPCKAGNEAFFKVDFADIIAKGTVISIIYDQNNIWVYCRYDNGLTYRHPIDDIGKTLFFTQEQAERKLKELESEKK